VAGMRRSKACLARPPEQAGSGPSRPSDGSIAARSTHAASGAGWRGPRAVRTAWRKSGSERCVRKGPTPLWNACAGARSACVGQAGAGRDTGQRPGAQRCAARLHKDVEGGDDQHQPHIEERHRHERQLAGRVHLRARLAERAAPRAATPAPRRRVAPGAARSCPPDSRGRLPLRRRAAWRTCPARRSAPPRWLRPSGAARAKGRAPRAGRTCTPPVRRAMGWHWRRAQPARQCAAAAGALASRARPLQCCMNPAAGKLPGSTGRVPCAVAARPSRVPGR